MPGGFSSVEAAALELLALAGEEPELVGGILAPLSPIVDLLDDAYRAAAKRHHPDKGGDPAKFARATACRDYITENRGTT